MTIRKAKLNYTKRITSNRTESSKAYRVRIGRKALYIDKKDIKKTALSEVVLIITFILLGQPLSKNFY